MESKPLVIAGATSVAIFGWEHFGRLNEVTYRPSFFLSKVADLFEFLFKQFGKILGFASGYIYII